MSYLNQNGEADEKLSFRRSYETEMICRVMRDAKEGDKVPYGRLAEAAGCSEEIVKRRLPTVRNALLSEKIKIQAIRGEGVMRLNDAGANELLRGQVHKVNRSTRRARRVYLALELEKLDQQQRIEAHASMAVLRAAELLTAPKGIKTIASNTTATDVLSIGTTLKLFD